MFSSVYSRLAAFCSAYLSQNPQAHKLGFDEPPKAAERPSILKDYYKVIPPFPDDLPRAPLLVISHEKLSRRDPEEVERFWQACTTLGFFYYDLRSEKSTPNGQEFLRAADRLFEFMPQAFDVPLEDKLKGRVEQYGTSMFGYKAKGNSIVDKKGTPDNMEHYLLGCRDIVGLSPPDPVTGAPFEGRHYPKVIVDAFPGPIRAFNDIGSATVLMFCEILSEKLGITSTALIDTHKITNKTATNVRFLKAIPRPKDHPSFDVPSLLAHTDWGSFTILFNIIGGLQVLVPQGVDPANPDEGWRWVKPIPGHAVINLGDSMVKFSNGLLRSNIHRVIAPPGEQSQEIRYALAFFQRPENDVWMRPMEGTNVPKSPEGEEDSEEAETYVQWMMRRALSWVNKSKALSDDEWKKTAGTEWKREE